MAAIQCPTCGQKFDSDKSPAMPFCSVRCRQIDLGRWLNEDISIPFRESEDYDPATEPDRPDDDH